MHRQHVGRAFGDYYQMSALEKTIFLADHIDEATEENEFLAKMFFLETANIDLSILTVLSGTVLKEISRTNRKPTPNRNIIDLYRKLFYDLIENRMSPGYSGKGNDIYLTAVNYILGNASDIKKHLYIFFNDLNKP